MDRTGISTVAMMLATIFIILSCNRDYSPNPRAYFRIEYPEKNYISYHNECSYSFDVPEYATVYPDTSYNAEPCWKNIYYHPFDAWLHLSYKSIDDPNSLMHFREDTRAFVYEHTVKARDISMQYLKLNENTTGLFYKLEGNTASAIQFYVSDSIEHFIRGALYFNAPANRDSLQPVIDFLEEDIKVFLHSLQWN